MKDKVRLWLAFVGFGLFIAAVGFWFVGAFIAQFWWFYVGVTAGLLSLACFRLSERMMLRP